MRIYRCPHLVRAARGRKSPSWKRDNYKNPVVYYGGQHEATRPVSKEKEKHSK
jgi:hypothetical protein